MLPNPFNNNSLPKPSFNSHTTSTTSASVTTLNPGPGLPQAAPVSYSNYVPRLQPAIKKTFGFGRGGSYSSGSQQFLPFSCDRCDRSFKSKELLDQHISEHIPCGINGCKFVAHPKIVEKHIQMQHETGLAEQIMRLTTPEEIEKWRAERKRKFPTKDNVERRQAEQKEKLDRGEVLYEPKKRFGRGGGNQRGRGRGGGRGRGHGRNHFKADQSADGGFRKPDAPASNQLPQSAPAPSPKSQVEEPSVVKEEKILSDGEIDSENEFTNHVVIPTSSCTSGLASLMGSYASASESDEDDKPAVTPVVKEEKITEVETGNVATDVKKEREKRTHRKRPNNKRKIKDQGGPSAPASKQFIRPKRLTLLQKLLQGEILHERNVILQCVHYIVQQKFFGIGQPDASQSSEPSAPESSS